MIKQAHFRLVFFYAPATWFPLKQDPTWVIKLDFIYMKMKLTKNIRYLQQKSSWKVCVPETTIDISLELARVTSLLQVNSQW